MNSMENANTIAKETVLKQISIDQKLTSKKKGFAYFNDLFVKRHSKLLLKSSKKVAMFSIIIFSILFLIVAMNQSMKKRYK